MKNLNLKIERIVSQIKNFRVHEEIETYEISEFFDEIRKNLGNEYIEVNSWSE